MRKALIASLVLLATPAAAAQDAQAPAAPEAGQPAGRPTIDWHIGELLANEQAAAILERHLPGIAAHPSRAQFETMTLRQVAPFSGGAINDEKIAAIAADLEALPAE